MSGLPPQPIQRPERQDGNRWLFLLWGAILGAALVTTIFVWQRARRTVQAPSFVAPTLPAPQMTWPDPPQVSEAPPRPVGKLWTINAIDKPMVVSMPIRRGFVESVTLIGSHPDYNINGEVKSYTQSVAVSVKNPKPTPIGPRVSVFLWDATQTKRAGGRIAHSGRADLEPGATKSFDELITSEFEPKFFEVVEHD